MDGEFAQVLTVHRDVGLLEASDQTAVGDAEGTAGGVETHDPQLTERRLVLAAVAISELLRALNGLEGVDVQTGLVSEVALGGFDRALLSAPILTGAKKYRFLPSICNDIGYHAIAFGKRKLKSPLNPCFPD